MIQPLDLQTIFVNYLAGSLDIFFFLCMVIFSILAARYRMSNTVFLVLMFIFVFIMSAISGYNLFLALTVIILGFFVYTMFSRFHGDT